MALDPDDRAALDIFRNPSLSPQDKQRLLGGDPSGGIPMPAPMPADMSGLPAGAVAGPGGGADAGQVATIQAALSGAPAAPAPPPAPASGPIPTAPPPGGFISDPTVANKPGIGGTVAQLQAEGPQPNPDAATVPPVAPSDAGGSSGGSGDYRGALRLLTPAGGPAPAPMEKVQQQTEVTGSGVGPEQIAELKAAAEKRDADALTLSHAEAQQAYAAGDIKVAAEKQAQAEKIALNATRDQALARADQILAQQDRISQQIVNTQPLEPGMMASKNFGDALFTVLSVFGAMAGAGSPAEAADRVAKIANREVQQQQLELEKKRGDVAQLDNLYGKHLANLKDHELAKQATIADIYGRAEAEIQSMIQSNGQAPDSPMNTRLQAEASDLAAKRQEFMADVQAKLGPKIHQEEAVSFMRKHLEPKAPGAPVAASGSSAVVGAHDTGSASQSIAAPGAAGKTAGMPHASGAAPHVDPIDQAAQAWNSGNPRQALALLPPAVKNAVLSQAARTQKGLGEGATKEDAIAYALHDLTDGQFHIPKQFIPQSAREKLVQIPGGAQGFAASKSQADKLQNEFNADASLVSAYSQLEQLTKLPASAWTPELRARIEAITTLIKPMTSVSLGQGAMSTEEQTLYSGVSGGDINSIKDFMLGTGKAMAHQALQVARGRMRARARSLSTDPFDFKPIEGE